MKEIITKEHYDKGFGGIYTRLYFDEEKYDISSFFDRKNSKYIISDKNKNILGIIEEDGVTAINQVYTTDGRCKFIVYISSPKYSEIEGETLYYYQIPTNKIMIYEDIDNELIYETEFELSSTQFLDNIKNLEKYNYNEIVFGVSGEQYMNRIYSINNGISPVYNNIVTTTQYRNPLGGIISNNTAFVQRVIESNIFIRGINRYYNELVDILSYVIDINTFEARSPIYSQKYGGTYEVYTKEELENGIIEIGRTEESIKELEKSYLKSANMIHNNFYDLDGNIDKEFVRKLINK